MTTALQLEPSLKQSATLAPAVIQNIKLLEQPADYLVAHLREFAARNLLLDPDRLEAAVAAEENEQGFSGIDAHPDIAIRIPEHLAPCAARPFEDDPNRPRPIENLASDTGDTLSAHLAWQIGALPLDDAKRALCLAIIYSLDEQGFLGSEDRAALARSVTDDEFASALTLVQSLDPPGVATADIQECLLSQIPRTRENKRLLTLVSRHFSALTDGSIAAVKRSMALSNDDFAALLEQLRSLTVIPSRGFASQAENRPVTCDLAFLPVDNVSIDVSLYGNHIARADLINPHYTDLLASHTLPTDAKALLASHHAEALSTLHGIRQRHATIELLGEYLAEQQAAFFLSGPAALKPLTMQQTADDLEISVAAVSRAIKDKYAATPFGAIPLRSLFSHPVVSASPGSETVSQAVLSSLITRLVRDEDPARPLSDEAISQELAQQHGIVLSRRTVAKHRAKLGIPTCSKRRAAKSLF